jgi:uncharacterized protein YndB with AHSA1/START domain
LTHSIEHATFTIERSYESAPARVFAAWSDPAVKGRWFGNSDEPSGDYELDFRVGGREVNRGTGPDGEMYTFEALYQDIVAEERIIYTYEMRRDDTRISVSLAAVEFTPEGEGTRLVLTEHGAFLDGQDKPEYREQGTGHLLDALDAELRREPARR